MLTLLVVVTMVGIGGLAAAQTGGYERPDPKADEVPWTIDNFQLTDQFGRSHELYSYGPVSEGIVLYTHGVGCPIVRYSLPKLRDIEEKYSEKGITFLMVNANYQDGREDVASELEEWNVDIPCLLDEDQLVIQMLGSQRTAEAILIDPDTWEIKYRGAVDDRYDYIGAREIPDNDYLIDALDAYIADKPIEQKFSVTKGCLINIFELPEDVSYTKEVASIIENKCVTCHKQGGTAPFAFDSYEKAKEFAPMIREVVLENRMPPWHADPKIGQFKNSRSLNYDEKRALMAWVKQGAKRGEDTDPLLKVKDLKAEKWPLGEPDMVISLPEPQDIPPQGLDEYRYVSVPSGVTEDKWLKAAHVRPSNEPATHHVLVFIEYPEHLKDKEPDTAGGLNSYFASHFPGQSPMEYPPDTGQWVPAGSKFQFQLHYAATGQPETDQTEMALYFHEEEPQRIFRVNSAFTTDFTIPPHEMEVPVSAEKWISRDSLLYAMAPHMHYRGSRVQYEVEYPEGKVEKLLSVPDYDFEWQTMYWLDEPKRLPAGSTIRVSGAWDNSARNDNNPDPNATVKFGDQTTEEMFIGYFTIAYDPDSPVKTPANANQPNNPGIRTGVDIDEKSIIGSEWNAWQYVFRFEPDGKLVVNDAVEGTWEIADGNVRMEIAGREPEFIIDGDTLKYDDGRYVTRVK